jgi:hypothetical protein
MRIVYKGRDNKFQIALEADHKVVAASDYNRFVLYLKDTKTAIVVTIDSNTAPVGTFDSTQMRFFNNKNVSVLTCQLGLGSFGLVTDAVYECYLRVYNAQSPNGITWPDHDDTFRLKVLEGP